MKSLLTYYNVKKDYYRYKLVESYLWKKKKPNIYNSYGELLVSITPLEESNPGWFSICLRKARSKDHKKLVIRFE